MGATHFGPYRLDAILSRGAAATVYRARDTSHHDRVVALKVFDRALSADSVFRARFRRDAGLLSALREPHVVPIHRHGEIDGRVFLDMRLVRGPSLADVLRDGPLAPPRAAAIAGQIGAATESLRRGGLGDRPLERADVLLTGPPGRGEFVQLVGLGLGRHPIPGAVAPPDVLVSGPARRGRRRISLAAAAVVAVTAAVLAVLVAIRPDEAGPAAAGEPGLVASIAEPAAAVVDADIVTSGGRQVLVAATLDGSLHTWDLATGRELRPPTAGAAVAVAAVAVDGATTLFVRNRDATVVAYDPDTGAPIGPPLGPRERVDPGSVPTWHGLEAIAIDGGPVAVIRQATGGQVPGFHGTPEAQIGLQLFALRASAPAGPVLAEEGQSIGAFELTEIDGRPVAVSIVGGRSVQARDLGTGAPVGRPTPPQPAGLLAVATAVRDGVPVAVTGGNDNTVRIWNLRTGEEAGPPLVGHTDRVAGLATIRVGDRLVIVSTAGAYPDPAASQVRFWDLATGAPLGAPLVGHPLGRGFVVQQDSGQGLLVATRPAEPITVWDAGRLMQEGTP
jgi:hypothetical protein